MNEDRLLVNRVVQGDRHAFQTLVAQHERLVVHIIGRLINRREEVEELCQDVFVKVYQKLPSFKFESKLSTWIATIAYRLGVNYLKKKKMLPEIKISEKQFLRSAAAEETPEQLAADKSVSQLVHHYIAQLPVHYRVVLTLYHLEGMHYEEIVEITGMPEGTVKNYLFRARHLLKEKLKAQVVKENLL